MPTNRTERSLRATFLGIGVNVLLVAGKLAGGILGHSHALIADAAESLADIFSSLIVWRAVVVAAEPADREHPYGHGKAEAIATGVVSTLLLLAALGIAVNAGRQLFEPRNPPRAFTLDILIGVVLVKELVFRYASRQASLAKSGAVKADAWHHRSDAITSLAAAIGISVCLLGGARFASFSVSYKETDLWIGVDPASYSPRMEDFAASLARSLRLELEAYIAVRPEFLASLAPISGDACAPLIARTMIAASAEAGVGPMAAVAGAVAEDVGAAIADEFGCREVLVENGGDLWLLFEEAIDISVFAGASPLSERVGVSIAPNFSPLGLCTSSGTVGPSLSLGTADAAMVACASAAAADAWATAVGKWAPSWNVASRSTTSPSKVARANPTGR